MNFRSKPKQELDVNITPLIDVVFLLLIFFMVSTTFDHQSELAIDLPEAKGQISETEDKIIDIAIDDKGQIYFNKNKLKDNTSAALLATFRNYLQQHQQPRVIISADKMTPHQSVMRVMDAARQLHINKLTFAAVHAE